jgi:hypothetical protein
MDKGTVLRKALRHPLRWSVQTARRALDFISLRAFLLAVSDTEKAHVWLRSRQKIRRKQVCS